jgi:hypothetical protein
MVLENGCVREIKHWVYFEYSMPNEGRLCDGFEIIIIIYFVNSYW